MTAVNSATALQEGSSQSKNAVPRRTMETPACSQHHFP